MIGRPSDYNEEIAQAICDEIIEGHSLRSVCASRDDFPSERTIYQWLEKHPEFAQHYARAREIQQDREADHIVEIADTEADANKARVRIDARKWRASKLAPKKYGDRLDLNHSGHIERYSDEQLDARLTELLGKAGSSGDTGGD